MGRQELRRRIIAMLLDRGFKLRRSELLRAPVDRICAIIWREDCPRLTRLRFETVEMLVKRGWDLTDMPAPDEKGKLSPDPLAEAVDETCDIVCEGATEGDIPEDSTIREQEDRLVKAVVAALKAVLDPPANEEQDSSIAGAAGTSAAKPETPKAASPKAK